LLLRNVSAPDRGAPSQLPDATPTLPIMHTVSPAPYDRADVPRLEAEVRRQRQRTPDAAMIAEARAPASAGHAVSSEEVDAWIDSLDTDHELPAPRSVR
jgi:hypothetical protein